MTPLEFWVSRPSYGTEKVDDSVVFTAPQLKSPAGKVCVVENEWEDDIVYALQLIHGGECPVIRHDGRTIREYYKEYTRVFTTWDPTDRNRI